MRINHIKINGFGKLENKELTLKNGINLIYGENETGKSTVQKFISGMFYGLSKNKNGKSISDYDFYNPWQGSEYSGKIEYELDNKNSFEVFRDFNRKNPNIYNEKKQDISLEFSSDKARGLKFFEEQTGVDEHTFNNTVITKQQNVKLDKSSQNSIIQKITNKLSSGDENISYQNTMDKLNKFQLEKIGTDRTFQKPKNLLENKIIELEKELQNEKILEIQKDEKISEILNINEAIEKETNKLSILKDMKYGLSSIKEQSAEIEFNRKLEDEYDEKISELQNKIDIRTKQNIKLQRKDYKMYYILIFVLMIIILGVYFILKTPIVFFGFIPVALLFLYVSIDNMLQNKKIKNKLKEIEEIQEKIKKEIEIIDNNKYEKALESKEKSEKLNNDMNQINEDIKNKYSGIIEDNFLNTVLAMEIEDTYSAVNLVENRINMLNLKLQSEQVELENISKKIGYIENVKSELKNNLEEMDKLVSLNKSIELAKEALKEAYEESRNQITPAFQERLNRIIENVSNNKYKNIIVNENDGLSIELNNGKYISAENLSIGTIDQIYLALRLSALKEITNENMPIILDEAFAYFDNRRLENFLTYISEECKDTQIIIFTCSNREEEIFKQKQLEYNKIEL